MKIMPNAPLPLKKVHHVELLVGNAKQAAYFYRKAFGFSQLAYAGPETGKRGQASYVLAQGNVRLVVSTPLTPDDPMSEHYRQHGDGVLDIAFLVNNVDEVFTEAVKRGAKVAEEPHDLSDKLGRVRRAKLKAYGDTLHSLIALDDYTGDFLPGYRIQRIPEPNFGLRTIDHIVGNVSDGEMDNWVDYYHSIFWLQSISVVRRQRYFDRVYRSAKQSNGKPNGTYQVSYQRTSRWYSQKPNSRIHRSQLRTWGATCCYDYD